MFDIAPEGEDDAHWRRRTEEDAHEVRRTPSTPMAAADQERPDRRERSDSRGQEGHVWHGEHHSAAGQTSSSRSTGPGDDQPHASRPRPQREHSDRPRTDHPYSDKPRTEGSVSDRPHTDRPYSDRPRTGRPYADRPRTEGPRLDGTPGTSRGTERPGSDNRRFQSSPRSGPSDRRGPRGTEEPRRKFVSRYAPDIKPVSHEKAATGSYSIWDGKAKTELPRFVRPDGTESTGGPRPNEHRGGPRPGASGRSSSGDGRPQGDRRGGSLGASRPGGSPGSVHRPSGGHGDPRDHRGSKSGPYNH
jgi:hypothetical protein